MNARIERVMDSENLGARITENGALGQKIWALEAFRGKTVFFKRFWGNYRIFGVVGGSWRKRNVSCEVRGFSRIFVEFWRVLEWFRTYS
jgi:hypothetical protein